MIDAVAQTLSADVPCPDGPTGVGFCMALNPHYLSLIPALDTTFGRGYGEEVDWCRKAIALGGRHVYQPRLFIEHRGAASFGADQKQALIRQSSAIIARRYPDFDGHVQDFLADDPLRSARLALGLAWAGAVATRAVPVYLAHTMGGGADTYLRARIAGDLTQMQAVIVLRVGGGLRWQVELHTDAGITAAATDDQALMQRLLAPVTHRRVVYSCGVGDRDPVALPQVLVELAQGSPVEVLMHDYFALTPSYTLLDSDGMFRGCPDPATTDRAHRVTRPDGTTVTLAAWRDAWGKLLRQADAITVFSPDSARLTALAYPDHAGRIVTKPHDSAAYAPVSVPQTRPVIGVLGNIGAQKGAAVLVALSRYLARDKRAGLVLLGQIDPQYRLAPPARIVGGYAPRDIPALAAKHGITCWLIPSVWPETFSYVTHEALATGLPVFSFDLGAQGDAVAQAAKARGQGGVISLADGRNDPAYIIYKILKIL